MDGTQPSPERIHDEWHALQRAVSRTVRGAELAEDVVQESWLRMLKAGPQQRGSALAWLHVVARRLVWENARARRHRRQRERAVARTETVLPPAAQCERDESPLRRYVAELRAPYRDVVTLRYFEDLSIGEIAARLGRSEGTVRSQLKRGLDTLRARIDVDDTHEARRSRLRSLLSLVFWRRAVEREAARPRRLVAGLAGVAVSVAVIAVGLLWLRREIAPPPAEAVAHAPDAAPASPGFARPAPPAASELETAVQGESAQPLIAHADAAPLALRGRAVSSQEGGPIAGGRVHVEDERATRVAAITAADGGFGLELDRFPAWIWVEHDEHAPTRRTRIDRGYAQTFGQVRLVSPRPGSLAGIVLDPEGRPLEGVEIELVDAVRPTERFGTLALLERAAPPVRRLTDARGSFRGPCTHSSRTRITARAAGFLDRTLHVDRDEPIRIVLERGDARAATDELREGQLARADGAPGCFVSGTLLRPSSSGSAELALRVESAGLEAGRRVPVSEDGRFRVGPLPSGEHALWIEGGGLHGAWRARAVVLEDGAPALELGPIVVPPPGSLQASVRSLAGNRLRPTALQLDADGSSARFHFRGGGLGIQFDLMNDEVHLERIWPGEYHVRVESKGGLAGARARVEAGARTSLELHVEPAKKLFVRARAPRGVPEGEEFRVELRTSAGARDLEEVAVTLDDPECALTLVCWVPDGAHSLVVTSTYGLHGTLDLRGAEPAHGARVVIDLTESEPRDGEPPRGE